MWDVFSGSRTRSGRMGTTSGQESDHKIGLLSPNIGNSSLSSQKPIGLLSDLGTPNGSGVQNNPQISHISEKGLQKSMFEEDRVVIGEQKASLVQKLNQIKEKKRIKLKQSQSNKKEFHGVMDEERDSDEDPFQDAPASNN